MKTKKILTSVVAVVGAAMIAVPSLFSQFHADTTISTIDKNRTGSITLHKYEQTEEVSSEYTHDGQESTQLPENVKPLGNVEFSVWYLGDNIGSDNYMLTVDEAEAYIADNSVSPVVLTTNADGIVKFDSLALGQYLVKETASPENVSEKTPAFIVNVPTTVTVDGEDRWLYDIHVYPKNQTIYGSVILNKVDEEDNKLAGAEFSLYADTTPEGSDVITGVLRAEGLVTNEHGQIAVENLPKGKYYFVETKAPEGYGLNTTPLRFEITSSGKIELNTDGLYVRLDEADGTQVLEFVNNHEPNIHKGVKSVTNQYAGYDFDEAHEWVISPDVPADIDTYIKYVVTDTIHENLIFSGLDTVKVYINGEWTEDTDGVAGTYSGGTLLTENTDYTVSYDETTRKLEVVFIRDEFKGGQTALKDAEGLYIMFNTTFDESKVELGKDYPNQATLTYNNSYTDDKDKISEEPKVHTGGLSLLKYTISNNETVVLAGAEFRLAETLEDANAGIFLKDKDGADIIATSDAQGIVKFEGVAYGKDDEPAETASSTYYLVETKSPEVDGVKYNLLDEPKEVVINATSHLIPLEESLKDISAWTYSVLNKTGLRLPTTGGIGTLIFYTIGGLLIVASAVMFKKSSKKSSNKTA